jgi:hypothetical protein
LNASNSCIAGSSSTINIFAFIIYPSSSRPQSVRAGKNMKDL